MRVPPHVIAGAEASRFDSPTRSFLPVFGAIDSSHFEAVDYPLIGFIVVMLSPPILGRQLARTSCAGCCSFSSTRIVAADVKKLGVIGAGQMVRRSQLVLSSLSLTVIL